MPLLQTLTSSFGVTDPSQEIFIVPSVTSVNEGLAVTFNIYTIGVPESTTLYYSTGGTINSSDTSQSLTGTLTVTNATANVSFTFTDDATTEGDETISLILRTISQSGPILAQSQPVTVVDTSQSPYGAFLYSGSATSHSNQNLELGISSATSWTVPSGVTSISIVCIGAGAGGAQGPSTNPFIAGNGGGGGALSYRNNISVTPGESLTIYAGRPASGIYANTRGGASYVLRGSTLLCGAQGGGTWFNGTPGVANQLPMTPGAYRMTSTSTFVSGSTASTATNGGGEGGTGGQWANSSYSASGGGGGGGYSGNGGQGGAEVQYFSGAFGRGQNGAGGGGGGGGMRKPGQAGGGGGASPFGWDGVTIYNGGANTGGDGSGYSQSYTGYTSGGGGKGFGGGGGGAVSATIGTRQGAPGCVRIVWPGSSRQFPNTDVAT